MFRGPLSNTRHPCALGTGLQENPRPRSVSQYGGEPLPAGDDPLLRDGFIRVADAELALAFVQIEPYRIDMAAGLPVCAPSQDGERVLDLWGRSVPPRYRGGPAAASYQLSAIR